MSIQKIEAQSPEARSADLMADNIAKLKAMFPELVTETTQGGKTTATLSVDVLKGLIGDATATDSEEKYGLNWHGKRRARQIALTPSTGTLRPCPDESVDWDTTQNLMIEGDNLEVLKLLQKSYAGKVKLIYIDPPYNTGKDFVYPDNFQDNIRNYLELTGQTEGGAKITSNTEASGRFHTDWLNMMYPRLKLARALLKRDGGFIREGAKAELDEARGLRDRLLVGDLDGGVQHEPSHRVREQLGVHRAHERAVGDADVVQLLRPEQVPDEVGAGAPGCGEPKLDDCGGAGLGCVGGEGPFERRQLNAGQRVQGVGETVQEGHQAGAEGLQRGEPREVGLERIAGERQPRCGALQAAGPGFFGEAFGEGRVGLLAQPA